jgi:hypothetical protein
MEATFMKDIGLVALGLGFLGQASEAAAQSNSFFRNHSNTRMQFNNRAAARSITRPKKAPAAAPAEPRPLSQDTAEAKPPRQ